MSFRALAQDYSMLPKVRTHAQLGGLGEPPGCSLWNPLTWDTCSTWIINARTELINAHNLIIDLANAWQQGIADIQTWPDSQEKVEAMSLAQAGYEGAREALTLDTQMMNEWEAQIQPWKNIGLAGIPNLRGIGRVGIAPAIAWGLITVTGLAISALAAWNISSALSAKAAYDSNTALYNSQSAYNRECGALLKAGKSCYGLIKPDGTPQTPWGSNIAMVAGVALIGMVAFFFATKR